MSSNALVIPLSSLTPFFCNGLQSGGTLLGPWWNIRPRNPIRALKEKEGGEPYATYAPQSLVVYFSGRLGRCHSGPAAARHAGVRVAIGVGVPVSPAPVVVAPPPAVVYPAPVV